MFDDEPPLSSTSRKRPRLETPALDAWGVSELREYIDELRAEIVRADAQIARKESHRDAAAAFFRPTATGG